MAVGWLVVKISRLLRQLVNPGFRFEIGHVLRSRALVRSDDSSRTLAVRKFVLPILTPEPASPHPQTVGLWVTRQMEFS